MAQSKTPSKPAWGAVNKQLASLQKFELIALLKDLHDLSPANRDFLRARCLSESDSAEVLQPYRQRIVEQFFPARGFGKLNLAEARKAIRDYQKATGSAAGTAELMMTYVENGARFTSTYGDIDERFYNSVISVLGELSKLLFREGPELYTEFHDRLERVEQMSNDIGWGFSDSIREIVSELGVEFDSEE